TCSREAHPGSRELFPEHRTTSHDSNSEARHPRDDRIPTTCRGAHSARPEPRTGPLRRGTAPRLRLGSFGATAYRAARRQTRSGANNAAASRLPRFRARPESTFHFLPCLAPYEFSSTTESSAHHSRRVRNI